ncbi:MAG: deoxyhypusine synthase [Candidatus Nezhaarchaeales archaeon]
MVGEGSLLTLRVEDISVHKGMTVNQLILQLAKAGGFSAKHLADAVDIVEATVRDEECTFFLAFPACIVATGVRGLIADMIGKGLVDVVITTGGTFDHDLARALGGAYYHGSFHVDDVELHKLRIQRLGNIFIPVDSYGPLIEKGVKPVLDELCKVKLKYSCRELAEEFGRRLTDEGSILRQAAKKGVPIYSPGLLDSAFGTQLTIHSQFSKLELDLIKDEKELLNIVYDSKRIGALILGGGISKHHTLWFSQFKGGLDYAVYITTATEYDGSLSGARTREAISWGKIKGKARQVTVEGDATIIFPIIVASLYERLGL